MIRDPIYGGLIKYLDSNASSWQTFDLDMWKEHRAFLELSDIAAPDPADDSHKSFSSRGYIAVSKVVFSDEASPPPEPGTALWLELLGSEPVDSLHSLATRYEQ